MSGRVRWMVTVRACGSVSMPCVRSQSRLALRALARAHDAREPGRELLVRWPATRGLQVPLHRRSYIHGPERTAVREPQPAPEREDVGPPPSAWRGHGRGERPDECGAGGALDPPVRDEAVVRQRAELRRAPGRVRRRVQPVHRDEAPGRVRHEGAQRAAAVRRERCVRGRPDRSAGDRNRGRAAPGLQPLDHARPVGVDACDVPFLAAGDPDGALPHRHPGGVATDPDGPRDDIARGIDLPQRAVVAVGDPHRTLADRQRARPVAHPDRGLDGAVAQLDPRHGPGLLTRHPESRPRRPRSRSGSRPPGSRGARPARW